MVTKFTACFSVVHESKTKYKRQYCPMETRKHEERSSRKLLQERERGDRNVQHLNSGLNRSSVQTRKHCFFAHDTDSAITCLFFFSFSYQKFQFSLLVGYMNHLLALLHIQADICPTRIKQKQNAI